MLKSWGPPAKSQLELAREVGISALWEKGIHGEGITVAVLDSGVNEEVLGVRLAWKIDLTSDNNPRDLLGHGTEMSKFILGYADRAQIGSIKVIDKCGLVTREVLIRALECCVERYPEIRVINISAGIRRRFWRWCWCTHDKPCNLCAMVNEVADLGLIVVAAAGNLGPGIDTLTCPGNAAGAYTIGASGKFPTSNWGRILEKYFPWLYYRLGEGSTGTSVSAALVSGALAILLSGLPDLKFNEIKEAIGITATLLQDGVREGHYYRAYKLLQHKRLGKPFDPDRAKKHYETGLQRRSNGEDKESIEEFEKAVELAPTSFIFYNELGLAYLR
ncbi:MAG: S8 family serine peptidase [Thermodesulfobacteriota bacterium]